MKANFRTPAAFKQLIGISLVLMLAIGQASGQKKAAESF